MCSQANKTRQEQAPLNIYINITERYRNCTVPSNENAILTQGDEVNVWTALMQYLLGGLFSFKQRFWTLAFCIAQCNMPQVCALV